MNDWSAALSPATPLNHVTMPGSYDSLVHSGKYEPMPGRVLGIQKGSVQTCVCQSTGIFGQATASIASIVTPASVEPISARAASRMTPMSEPDPYEASTSVLPAVKSSVTKHPLRPHNNTPRILARVKKVSIAVNQVFTYF